MARTPREPLTPIHFLAPPKMLEELKVEERRTGLSRTALLKVAWKEYVERHPVTTPKRPA